MFPNQKVNTQPTQQRSISNSGNTSFYFDFEKGDFLESDGKIKTVSDFDSLKNRIQKIIYDLNLIDILTSGFQQSFIYSEIESLLKTELLKYSLILNVYDFDFTRERKTLIVNCSIDTVYGTTKEVIKI